MPRKWIAAGNWKMNTSVTQGLQLAMDIKEGKRSDNVVTILAVPFTHLFPIKKKMGTQSKILLAAQDCHYKSSGAYTGEISPDMLAELKIPYVILGHSERRAYNHESNEFLASKVNAALTSGLKIIFCCGESLDVRKSGNHIPYVRVQLAESLFHLSREEFKNITIAYEPIWAIGTGETATPDQAQEIHGEIRELLRKKYGKRTAENTSILYGGSVKPSNASEIFSKPDVDGGLVGGASLVAEDFLKIINSFTE